MAVQARHQVGVNPAIAPKGQSAHLRSSILFNTVAPTHSTHGKARRGRETLDSSMPENRISLSQSLPVTGSKSCLSIIGHWLNATQAAIPLAFLCHLPQQWADERPLQHP